MKKKIDWPLVRCKALVYGRNAVLDYLIFPVFFIVGNIAFIIPQLHNLPPHP